jgi:hypothetical protein
VLTYGAKRKTMLCMRSTLTTLDDPRRRIVKADAPFHNDEQLDNPAKLDGGDPECVALDNKAQPELIRQIGEHVDTIAHELAELLGAPSVLAAPDAPAPDDRKARDGAPMLTAITGGAP